MRKRLLHKVFPWTLVFVLTASLLAACGGGSTNSSSGSQDNSQSKSAQSTSNAKGGGDTAKGSGKVTDINIWTWDNSATRKQMYADFEKAYPQYHVVNTIVQNADMAQKLQTTLASGGQMPDVAWLEATNRGKLFSLGIWEDLSKPPYNIDTSKVLPWLLPLDSTSDGAYVGPEAPSVAGIAYKRALAKQYFGTDDPTALKNMFTNWDTFIQKGIEVKQKSGGKVYMLASLDDAFTFFKGQTSTPFVKGTQLNLKASLTPIFDELVKMKKAGIVDVLDGSSPAEGASYADNVHIFYPCASWSVKFTIEANDKNGIGRWGFTIPPGGPFPWGGTVQGVPKQAKNKAGAVALIKWLFLTKQGSELSRDLKGNFSPLKSIYDDPNFYSGKDKYFAGQDVLKAFATDVLPKIDVKSVRAPNQYDQDINNEITLALKTINASKDGNVDVAALIKKMEDDLTNQHTELKAD